MTTLELILTIIQLLSGLAVTVIVLMQSGNEERQHCHGQQQGDRLCGAPQGFVFHDCSSVRSSA